MISKENILKLYNGEYSFEECPPLRTELYHESIIKCDELHRSLSSKLEKYDEHIIEDLLDAFGDMYSEEIKQAYIEGFSMGLRLAVEAL